MAKKDIVRDREYVNERVDKVWKELVEALAYNAYADEQGGKLVSEIVSEMSPKFKKDYAHMTQEGLLDELAYFRATLMMRKMQFLTLREALEKAEQGLRLLPIVGKQAISEHASKRAFNGHAATHDAKRTVFDWCDKHHHEYPRDMDGMAAAITESHPPLVVQKWDTVRGWIAEWKKDRKLGAASKPDSN
jgi:hypothetical protein